MGCISVSILQVGYESHHGAGFRITHIQYLTGAFRKTKIRATTFQILQNVTKRTQANATSPASTHHLVTWCRITGNTKTGFTLVQLSFQSETHFFKQFGWPYVITDSFRNQTTSTHNAPNNRES
jgi:hypothetical protein